MAALCPLRRCCAALNPQGRADCGPWHLPGIKGEARRAAPARSGGLALWSGCARRWPRKNWTAINCATEPWLRHPTGWRCPARNPHRPVHSGLRVWIRRLEVERQQWAVRARWVIPRLKLRVQFPTPAPAQSSTKRRIHPVQRGAVLLLRPGAHGLQRQSSPGINPERGQGMGRHRSPSGTWACCAQSKGARICLFVRIRPNKGRIPVFLIRRSTETY
jgi:hypothetical protein